MLNLNHQATTLSPSRSFILAGSALLLLAGCQSSPPPSAPIRTVVIAPPAPVVVVTPEPVVIQPTHTLPALRAEPLQAESLPSPMGQSRPIIVPLPQPAPRNGMRRDGHNIPAFNGLLTVAREQISQTKWADAEQTLTRAQRMAPDSPAVYAHFAEIAIKRQQWNRADAMARRGLLLTQNPQQQRTFWQIVLLSARQQNNVRGVQEAQQKLAQLR